MIRGLRLYLAFTSQYLKTRLAYRTDFFVSNLGTTFMMASQVLFIYLVFRQVRVVNGWSFAEVLFIYGLSSLAVALAQAFTMHLAFIPYVIIEGQFDSFLIRPLDPFWHYLMSRFNDDWVVVSLIRLLIMATAAATLAVTWTPWALLILTGFVICGSLINAAINAIFSSFAFRFLEIEALYWLYIGDFYNLSYYPLTIYHQFLQLLLTWVFPLAFVSIVPAAHFVGKTYYALYAPLVPLITVALVILARYAWVNGLRQYESTGS